MRIILPAGNYHCFHPGLPVPSAFKIIYEEDCGCYSFMPRTLRVVKSIMKA